MIQVFRQTEKNQVQLSIQFQMVRRKNMEIFLKEPMKDNMRRKGEEE